MVSLLIIAVGLMLVVGFFRILGFYAYDFFLYRLMPILAFAGGLYLMALIFGRF